MKKLLSTITALWIALTLQAADVARTSVEQLTNDYFLMATDNSGDWQSPYWTASNNQNVLQGASASICGGSVNYYLLKAEAVSYQDETVYRLAIYNAAHETFPKGVGGGYYLNSAGWVFFAGVSEAEGKSHVYGQDNDALGVWRITYTEGKGFQFQCVGNSKYINYTMGHSSTADKYYWQCFADGSLYNDAEALKQSSAYAAYQLLSTTLADWQDNTTAFTAADADRQALSDALSSAASQIATAGTVDDIDIVNQQLRTAAITFIQQVQLAEGTQLNLKPLLLNASFGSNDSYGWGGTEPAFQKYGNGEFFSKNFNLSQTLQGMPQGRYLLRVQSFQRRRSDAEKAMTDYVNGVTTTSEVYLYANDEQAAVANIGRDAQTTNAVGGQKVTINEQDYWLPSDMSSSNKFFSNGFYWNELIVHQLTNGDMTIGLRSTDNSTFGFWTMVDNFELYWQGTQSDVSDLTYRLTNPSFETGTTAGWTVGKPSGADTGAKKNEGVYATNGTDGDYLFNAFAISESQVYDTPVHFVEQTLHDVLPGEYRLRALCASSTYSNGANTPVELYANSQYTAFVPQSKGTFQQDYELTFFLSPSESDLTLGMRSASWFKADHFRLVYYGETDAYDEQRRLAVVNRYEHIASQALDRSAYDQVLSEVRATLMRSDVTDDEISLANAQLRTALMELVRTGQTATGQFDLTVLLDNSSTQQLRGTSAPAELSQTLADMPAGHYTLRAHAFYRPAETAIAVEQYEAGTDEHAAHLFIGNDETLAPSIFDGARHTVTSTVDYYAMADGRGIPTTQSTAVGSFVCGQYGTAVETDLQADGELTLGLRVDATQQEGNWLIADRLQLLYGATPMVTIQKTVTAGVLTPLCVPVSLTAAEVGELYSIGGIADGTATLWPVGSVRAGQPCVIRATTDIDGFTVAATEVSSERADIIPLPWQGGTMTAAADSYSWTVTSLDGQTTTAAEQLQFTVADPLDMDFTVNVENLQVRRFMQLEDYTATTSSHIGNYNVAPPARRDQANCVAIPLSADDVTSDVIPELTLTYADGTAVTLPGREVVVAANRQVLYIGGLIPQRDYHYTVTAAGQTIAAGRFHTDGQLRQLYVPSISNVRDLGGWQVADGRRIRYGLVYRGGELNGDHVATAADRQALLDLGIGAEIDLRIDYDNNGAGTSAFGFSAEEGTFYYANANDFVTENMTSAESHARWKAEFDLLLANLRAGRSVYFHCIWGADRTGLFSLLLEGLLGMSQDQSNKNYELTSFSLAGARWRGSQDGFFNHIRSLQGETLQEQFNTFFRESLGVSQDDIDDFRDIMLNEPQPEGPTTEISNAWRPINQDSILQEVYDLSGRRITNIQSYHGFFILRYSGGTIRKTHL
ncbi:MAG: tyrosine-protein phosphatase [Prevotella sp.]|nr:tyrosine-protein phosphatase [Prevotella sp.]